MIDAPQYERLIGTTLGPYYIEQLSEWNELGPIFVARHNMDGGTFRIRPLDVPADFSQNEFAAYLQRFDHQAQHIATLQHPYILPLTQFSSVSGLYYLVSPFPTARSLTTRLKRSGPVDILTAGRYLDQIAAALEYAHERNTLHRNLTTDAILLQLDGQIVVADFGVRRMLELAEREGQHNPLRFLNASSAPEQLLGAAVERPTDVYALGAVLYQLLTGNPVFIANSPQQLVEQQLHAPVPLVSSRRPGLPQGLDAVFAKALAKQPQDRYQHPGALANAYSQVVSPNNAARVPFVVSQPVRRQDSPSTYASFASQPRRSNVGGSSGPSSSYGVRITELDPVAAAPSGPYFGDRTPLPSNRKQLPMGRTALVALVLVALVIGGAFGLRALNGGGPSGPASGQITFLDSQQGGVGLTNALHLVVRNLGEPPSGSSYYAWLIDTQAEHVMPLGRLNIQDGSASLNYTSGASSNADLLGLGNTVEITQENGSVTVPVGKVVLAASFPPKTFVHIQHVLVAFPATPDHAGLLVGGLRQYQLLSAQVQALSQIKGVRASVRCEAQGIVNILEGAKGADYQPLPSECSAQRTISSGDGFGLLGPKADGTGGGYIVTAAAHASLAATQPDATSSIHDHAAQVESALNSVRTSSLAVQEDAVDLVHNPSDTSKVADMVTLVSNAYQNGMLTAYAQAQQMATLTLAPRS
ncbi:MAG TPA: serine/threonine-protein kinase [Ktedonobacterales bacterium]|jgi:serine/threonine protein kinase|nr:serine/threonine-protein kinase [Ktedonobacterales bacterium]